MYYLVNKPNVGLIINIWLSREVFFKFKTIMLFGVQSKYFTVRYYTTTITNSRRLGRIPKAYNPTDLEVKILQKWTERKTTSHSSLLENDNTSFRMIFPPPNVTGKLHLGHAYTVAIQDTIARLKLMRGYNVDWIPGFDHAGIATHSVVTRKLSKLGKTFNLEQLKREFENHASTNRENIKEQLKRLGALLDWDKEYYTMDENHSHVVKEAFMHLFENGIIRRGDGLINWCFSLKSSVADIEVDEIEFNGRKIIEVPGYSRGIEFGLLYHVAYQFKDSEAKLVVVTSRPETMFGDVAVAVNPQDTKNSRFIGKCVINPINGTTLNVIADSRVKMHFGTGVVKITPAHDKLDFVIGVDHKLPCIKLFDADGHMNENCREFQGIPRFTAREKVILHLKDCGALVDVEDYSGSIGTCSRTHDIIEPMVHPHWFFQTEVFNEKVVHYIRTGELIIRPDNIQQAFLHQLPKMHDWCLSRQIRWGHQIPAYFHKDYPEEWVTASCKKAAVDKLKRKLDIDIPDEEKVCQDTDVLDTWFSSALIPLSLSNWPESDDFKEISLMETGHDILLFWVWRMILLNLAMVGKLPFRNVLLHGVVVDSYGRKMSKSKGNVLDPMHIIEGRDFVSLKEETEGFLNSGELTLSEFALKTKSMEHHFPGGFPSCGADALRFALLGQDIYDQNVTINVEYLENCKHFCNKLWQAMRLYLHYMEGSSMSFEDIESLRSADYSKLPLMNRWILSALYDFVKKYETNIRDCKFHLVTEGIRSFFYSEYCDVYLEFAKFELKQQVNVLQHLRVMYFVLCTTMKMAHPFLPFVSEEIWGVLTDDKTGILLDCRQPGIDELVEFQDARIAKQVEKLFRLLKQVRSFRGKYFPATKEYPIILVEIHMDDKDVIEAGSYIKSVSKTELNFDIFGRKETSDSLAIVFDLEGGRSCRISCSRSDPALKIPTMEDSKLLKLQSKWTELKQQFDNPAFQQTASETAKKKLLKKLKLLLSRIEAADPSWKQPSDTSS